MSWLARLALHVLVGITLAVLDRVLQGRLKQTTWLVDRPHERKFTLAVCLELILLVGVWLSGNPELLLGLALLLPNAIALVVGVDLAELGMRLLERMRGRDRMPRVEVLPPGAEEALPRPGPIIDAEQVLDAPSAFEQEEARRSKTRSSLDDKLRGY